VDELIWRTIAYAGGTKSVPRTHWESAVAELIADPDLTQGSIASTMRPLRLGSSLLEWELNPGSGRNSGFPNLAAYDSPRIDEVFLGLLQNVGRQR
jgi:hypothetical protein